eukprot:782353-Pleurochrysis_carterae.AAC.2
MRCRHGRVSCERQGFGMVSVKGKEVKTGVKGFLMCDGECCAALCVNASLAGTGQRRLFRSVPDTL